MIVNARLGLKCLTIAINTQAYYSVVCDYNITETLTQLFIVSKSLSQTTMCPQTFIVKISIIKNMHSHYVYMKQKEGASVQDNGETERERERETVSR